MDGVLTVPLKGFWYPSRSVCTRCSPTDSHPVTHCLKMYYVENPDYCLPSGCTPDAQPGDKSRPLSSFVDGVDKAKSKLAGGVQCGSRTFKFEGFFRAFLSRVYFTLA